MQKKDLDTFDRGKEVGPAIFYESIRYASQRGALNTEGCR
jgi:hypothetical protein